MLVEGNEKTITKSGPQKVRYHDEIKSTAKCKLANYTRTAHTAKEWMEPLTTNVFRVNRLFLTRHAPSSTASSLNIR